MRCRLAPDSTKLVICTTGGYLILIHDLDLNTLARDLQGFRVSIFHCLIIANLKKSTNNTTRD